MARVTKVILQARTSSSRLPAKVLLPVGGLPLVVLAARRAMRAGFEFAVATSVDPSDDILAAVLGQHSIQVVRGSLEDVLDRFVKATAELPSDGLVVRLTADNVFPDGDFVRQLVAAFLARGVKYLCCGADNRRIPYGMSGEVFEVSALRAAAARATSPYDREHVTPWIKRAYVASESSWSPDVESDYGHLRCTVDTLDDYLKIAAVFDRVNDPLVEPWRTLVARLQEMKPSGTLVQDTVRCGARMVLGTAQLGLGYGRGNVTGIPSEEEASAILRCAVENGVSEVDTARAYGASENRIGSFLSERAMKHVTPLTKLDPLNDLRDDWPSAAIHASVDASVLASCRALRLPRLPVLMLHRYAHIRIAQGQVWSRLLSLQNEGLINHLGISIQSPAELEQALTVREIEHVQLPYNILDWRWENCSELLSTRPDVKVHVRSVYLQGLLLAKSPEIWPLIGAVEPREILSSIQRLSFQLNRQSVPDLLIAYVRSQPWITGVVIGVETLAQLRSNIELFRLPCLTSVERRIVRAALPRVALRLLDPAQWP